MIEFNIPFKNKKQLLNLNEIFEGIKFSGDGYFTKKCTEWFNNRYNPKKALLTSSCSHALDMSAILADIKEGDEVIMASYTFVSTANAFVLRGAKIVFVDINPNTMNIDENLIAAAITSKTKAIVPMHYAGVSCNMDEILKIADEYDLLVIEDAAQCIGSYYKGKPVGSLGDISCFSFHDTKNIHCGEGGLLLINNPKFSERSEIIREKGTNRSKFIRGQVDKYSWVDIGSSFLPSDINAAVLLAQLEVEENITSKRLFLWNLYFDKLSALNLSRFIELPKVPNECKHNGHMFYIKLKDINERQELISFLKDKGISSVFHYIPLHTSIAGYKYARFHGKDVYTTQESERLLRLPLHYDLSEDEVVEVIKTIENFFTDK